MFITAADIRVKRYSDETCLWKVYIYRHPNLYGLGNSVHQATDQLVQLLLQRNIPFNFEDLTFKYVISKGQRWRS